MALNLVPFNDEYKEKWDSFVLNKSINGTFLQTRKFLDYHPADRFIDSSLIILKGNEIVGVIPANMQYEGDKKVFYSHQGTSYGGIIISNNVYSASNVKEIVKMIEEYLTEKKYYKIFLKLTPDIYQNSNSILIDYFLYQFNYTQYNELNYYLDLENYQVDILSQFSSSKRRDYRYSLKYNLSFKMLESEEEIFDYYKVLQLNLQKLNLTSVHSYEDLIDLKFNRFGEEIEFYGVFYDEKMIAGSMIFYIGDDIIHTQYLSSNEEYLKIYPMDFLIYNLIEIAVKKKKKYFSFGICTEDKGKYLNIGLSRFKEGFGCKFSLNNSFEKELINEKEEH